jgi:hypothetical protein
MSQPAAAQDSFVPFDPVHGSGSARSGTPPGLKVVAKAEAGPAFAPLPTSASAHLHATTGPGKPVVTLQREGECVTGIRIECVCGQIIELACSY